MLKARLDILLSIPGLGEVTALALLIDMPEPGSMDAKQAASLAGLAPRTRQSGNWRGKSFIQGGRTQLRQAPYMPALVAIRFNPPLKPTDTALRKLAIVAVMRKLIVIADALPRDHRVWTLEPAKPSDRSPQSDPVAFSGSVETPSSRPGHTTHRNRAVAVKAGRRPSRRGAQRP